MIEDPDLDKDARQALDTGKAIQRDVRDPEGRLLRRTVEPYQSDIGGVVVTYHAANLDGGDQKLDPSTKDIVQSLSLGMMPIGVWTLEADGSCMDWDECFSEITGLRRKGQSLEECGFKEQILAEDLPQFESSLKALIDGGEPQNLELRFSVSGKPVRWLQLRSKLVNQNGHNMIVGILADVTERKSASERSDFMMRELDHRVKNLLAIILSIAEITGRSNSNIETFKADFRARLESMARTHNLLAQTQWSGADLRLLVEGEVYSLAPKSAVIIEGPSLEVSPTAAQSLAMFFHELTANALKHGALAHNAGQIAISWTIDPSRDRLELKWVESGGNGVSRPANEGFGGKVINRIVKRQLDAEVGTQWLAEGIELNASVPLQSIAASAPIDEARA